MKHCPTCNTTKPAAEFYRDRRQLDGLKGQCKRCHCAGTVRTRDADKHRVKNAEHARKARQADPSKFRERERLASARRRIADPVKVAARQALNNAVKRGDVSRPALCQECGCEGKLSGHHDDYSKPLAVRWLCYSCHATLHRMTAINQARDAAMKERA